MSGEIKDVELHLDYAKHMLVASVLGSVRACSALYKSDGVFHL